MKIKFPFRLLRPIYDYLVNQEKKLKARKKSLALEDPYNNTDRLADNAAIDTDAAEQEGHLRVSALRKEIDKNIIRIRKTLTRIKLGKYGLCTNCGKMIDTERLAIYPTAERCMECHKRAQSSKLKIKK